MMETSPNAIAPNRLHWLLVIVAAIIAALIVFDLSTGKPRSALRDGALGVVFLGAAARRATTKVQ